MRINPCLNSKSVGERKEKLENYEGPNEIKIAVPITKFVLTILMRMLVKCYMVLCL